MITITGSGNLTRAPELRQTESGKAVTTVSVACHGRTRDEEPTYVDLILWEAQAEAAVQHLTKGQAVSFSGRPSVHTYKRNNGELAATLEVNGVMLEYGAKARDQRPDEEPEAQAA